LMLLAAGAAVAVRGVKLGIDFAGGTEVQVGFVEEAGASDGAIREVVATCGITDASVVRFGGGSEFLIKFAAPPAEALEAALDSEACPLEDWQRRELAQNAATAPPTDSSLVSGISSLDRLLAEELHRGRMVELVGRRSAGRFSTILSILAAATGAGEAAALVDLGDNLDPQAAAAAGTVLERLLWARPHRVKEALASTEMLLNSGFSLVVLELGSPPLSGGRGSEASWLRLARAAAGQGGMLLVSSPYRASGTAADSVLEARQAWPVWSSRKGSPRLLVGLSCRLTLQKCRHRRPGRSEPLTLTLPEVVEPLPHASAERKALPYEPPVPGIAPRPALIAERAG